MPMAVIATVTDYTEGIPFVTEVYSDFNIMP